MNKIKPTPIKKPIISELCFIAWDYDNMIATEYERHGECNECGACCRARITVRGKRDGNSGPYIGELNGTWSEVAEGGNRIFFKTKLIEPENSGQLCPSFEDNKCTNHNNRQNICTKWPFTPRDLEQFPDCSYSFTEVNKWEF